MPNAQLTNPKGAGYFNAAIEGGLNLDFEIDSAVSGSSPIGTVVEIENFAGPGTSNPPTVPLVKPSSTTADSKVVGVIVGGQSANSNSGTGGVPPGDIANVRVIGIAQVLCDATTTAGQPLIQSAATAGCAKTTGSAVTAGQGIGICLQAVTISSGTALVWALIFKF
jgi:hypothetical protein